MLSKISQGTLEKHGWILSTPRYVQAYSGREHGSRKSAQRLKLQSSHMFTKMINLWEQCFKPTLTPGAGCRHGQHQGLRLGFLISIPYFSAGDPRFQNFSFFKKVGPRRNSKALRVRAAKMGLTFCGGHVYLFLPKNDNKHNDKSDNTEYN